MPTCRFAILICLVLIPVLRLAASESGDVLLDDFSAKQLQLGSREGEHAISFSLRSDPASASAQVISLAWAKSHGAWVECCYADRFLRPLPPFVTVGGGILTMRVWAEAFAGIKYLAIRISDAEGETFEWRVDLPHPEQTGWRSLSVPLGLAASTGHWGPWKDGVETGNGHADGLLALQGFAVAFADEHAFEGGILLGEIRIRQPAGH